MAPPLLLLALEFHRAPLCFRHLSDPRRRLPEAFGDWLMEASAALAPVRVEATAAALGMAPEALREAYRFLLREMLLIPQADHYRVLGLSRRCGPESIKQHRSLLVGLFHPDHLPEPDERSLSITVRINVAYQVLRDPQARQRYDNRLPPIPCVRGATDDPGGFFRPQGPVASVTGQTRAVRSVRARSLLFWTLLCVILMALVYLILREPRQPLLRLNPDLAALAVAERSCLQGGAGSIGATARPSADQEAPPVLHSAAKVAASDRAEVGRPKRLAERLGSGVQSSRPAGFGGGGSADRSMSEVVRRAGQEESPAPVARKVVAAVRPQPSHSPSLGADAERAKPALEIRERRRDPSSQHANRASGGEPNPTQAVSALLRRLEGAFARGDLVGLARLFTANAVVNDRVGAAAVRHAYAEMVGQADQGRVTLSGLRWRTRQHDLLLGQGTMRISTRNGSRQAWSNLDGTVEIELVPWMGDYRVSKLTHHFPR